MLLEVWSEWSEQMGDLRAIVLDCPLRLIGSISIANTFRSLPLSATLLQELAKPGKQVRNRPRNARNDNESRHNL